MAVTSLGGFASGAVCGPRKLSLPWASSDVRSVFLASGWGEALAGRGAIGPGGRSCLPPTPHLCASQGPCARPHVGEGSDLVSLEPPDVPFFQFYFFHRGIIFYF